MKEHRPYNTCELLDQPFITDKTRLVFLPSGSLLYNQLPKIIAFRGVSGNFHPVSL